MVFNVWESIKSAATSKAIEGIAGPVWQQVKHEFNHVQGPVTPQIAQKIMMEKINSDLKFSNMMMGLLKQHTGRAEILDSHWQHVADFINKNRNIY